MSDSSVAPQAPSSDLAERAIALAERWVAESAEVTVDPSAERLAGVLKDPNGLPFTLGFVDGVMRPESLTAAATNLQRVAPLAPAFLPWYLRAAVRTGGVVAPVLPTPVVPIARRVLREMVGHLIVDARPDKLGPALQTLRESGARLNLNLLGEAVLGEAEALAQHGCFLEPATDGGRRREASDRLRHLDRRVAHAIAARSVSNASTRRR